MEKNYDFLKRFQIIHQPDRRTVFDLPDNSVEITSQWLIRVPAAPGAAEIRAAEDLLDYLKVSMGIILPLIKSDTVCGKEILFQDSKSGKIRGAYDITASTERIAVCGDDSRGVLRGNIALEDQMNLAGGPYITTGNARFEPLLKARIIHSGSGIDDFPDWQLDAIRHAGFTAIDHFVRDFDLNGKREKCDIADIIERADSYGLDTVLYNYLRCFKHPDEPDADQFFDSIYGELFRRYPKAWGISLVGESLEFPSKDPNTTGKRYSESTIDGIPDTRPSPGWYPCYDYPALLQKIVDNIRRVKPDANIVFSTYNWSYLPPEPREKFLDTVPEGLTINIACEMQHTKKIDGVFFPVMDYTVSAPEPGDYFKTECAAADKNSLPIRVCSNTGGMTWDFGAVPYIPVPQLWLRRMRALRPYVLNCGADYFYEGHHFGWWPNVANDLMKKLYNSIDVQDDDLDFLRRLAVRDYGTEEVVRVWELWSEALTHIVTSNEDQYGPLRTGPSYPFVFHANITRTLLPKEIPFPTMPGAMFGGNAIIKTFYQPFESDGQSPAVLRYPIDLREMSTMETLWQKGLTLLETLIPAMPEGLKAENGRYLAALGQYIQCSIRTVINIKRWYIANKKLQMEADRAAALKLLDELTAIIADEKANVKKTIPAVEFDSRLGWEPSMEYVCDKTRLDWKMRQLDSTLREMEQYRAIVNLK